MLLPLVGCGSALVQSHWQAHSFPPPPRNPESAGAVPPLPPVSSWRKVDTSADASALHQKSARNAYEQNLHHENALRKRITKTATRNPRYHNAEKRRKARIQSATQKRDANARHGKRVMEACDVSCSHLIRLSRSTPFPFYSRQRT